MHGTLGRRGAGVHGVGTAGGLTGTLSPALALAPAPAQARTRTRTLAQAPARCLFLTSAPAERRQCSALVVRSTSSAPAERSSSTCKAK